MVSITVTLDDKTKAKIEKFSWVNWSELAREEAIKKEIFERYIKTGRIAKEDEKFCEESDWHPVDELPLREEYVKKLKRIEKGPHSKAMNSEELDKWFDKL